MRVPCHSKIGETGTVTETGTEIGIVVMIGQIEETEGRADLEGVADGGEAEAVIELAVVGIRSMDDRGCCVIKSRLSIPFHEHM